MNNYVCERLELGQSSKNMKVKRLPLNAVYVNFLSYIVLMTLLRIQLLYVVMSNII